MAHHLLAGVIYAWSGYYGNHPFVSVFVRFAHLSAIALGGGSALLTDLWVLKAKNAQLTEKESVFQSLRRIHGYVIPWIAVLVVTGILMTLADFDTFWNSRIYWIKMALVAMLIMNGVTLLLAEHRTRRIGLAAGWRRLVRVSMISFILWITTLFAGTYLTVAG